MARIYKKDVPITWSNIGEIIEKIEKKSSQKQKEVLVTMSGGRDPITKSKMVDVTGKSTARKIKDIPVVIDSRNGELYKKFSKKELVEMQMETIICYDEFCRGEIYEEE